jgi:hypothetical protein
MRRLSYGLLATLVAAFAIGCDNPPADAPPQPSAAPSAEASAAPAQSASAEAAPPPAPEKPAEPPPPPPKPAKDKWSGSFVQDFSGDVADTANTAAQKAGGAKKDQKKIDAALEKSKKAFTDNGSAIDATGDGFTWNVKGKPAHTAKIKVVKGDDPSALSIQIVNDNKKDLKKPIDVSITFTDDNTFTMKDPFAKDPAKAPTIVFKRK